MVWIIMSLLFVLLLNSAKSNSQQVYHQEVYKKPFNSPQYDNSLKNIDVKNEPNYRKIIRMNEIDEDEFYDNSEEAADHEINELELNKLTNYLFELLIQPEWKSPIIAIENIENNQRNDDELLNQPMEKRGKYYSSKRHSSRSRNSYDYEPPSLCTPSREDVYQLLVALHEVRQGNKQRKVNFCKRRRPVSTVFTSIRFLGR